MNKTIPLALLLAGIALSMLFPGCTGSDSDDMGGSDQQNVPAQERGQEPGGRMRGPQGGMDVQYVEACSGKSPGDSCTLNFRNQSVDGTCADSNGSMTCQPVNGSLMQGPRMPRGRNEESVQACGGKAAGEACTVTFRNQTTDGTCSDRTGTVMCVPNDMGSPRGRQGAHPEGL